MRVGDVVKRLENVRTANWCQACRDAKREPDGYFKVVAKSQNFKGFYSLEGLQGTFSSDFFEVIPQPMEIKPVNTNVLNNLEGLFRVSGLFEDKARICHIIDGTGYHMGELTFYPINDQIEPVTASQNLVETLMKKGAVQIMCVERP